MPTIVPFLAKMLDEWTTFLSLQSLSGQVATLATAVNDLARWIINLSAVVFWFGTQQVEAWTDAQASADATGKALEQIVSDQSDMWLHLMQRILPDTLNYLNGYVFSTGIVPLRQHLRQVDGEIESIQDWENKTQTWRDTTVTPVVNAWNIFGTWWNDHFASQAATLIDWIANPSHFANFAVPAIARPLVTYWADPQHTVLQDDLTTNLVNAWASAPDRVWNGILEFMVTPFN